MLDGQPVVDDLLERVDPDPQVQPGKILCHLSIRHGGLDAIRFHWLVGDQQQRPGGNLVVEPGDENCGRFHVDCHGADAAQIILELLVVFPDAPVGRVDRAGPVIVLP